MMLRNFWSIVLDDHWSKKIYRPKMIVCFMVLYSFWWSCNLVIVIVTSGYCHSIVTVIVIALVIAIVIVNSWTEILTIWQKKCFPLVNLTRWAILFFEEGITCNHFLLSLLTQDLNKRRCMGKYWQPVRKNLVDLNPKLWFWKRMNAW